MIYLDTSALLKHLVEEDHSSALDHYLRATTGVAFTSTLAEVELPLALGRGGLDPRPARELLRQLAAVDMTAEIRHRAAGYGALRLRALDAIHVATAALLIEALGEVITVVTYDRRMVEACERLGLATATPGVDTSPAS